MAPTAQLGANLGASLANLGPTRGSGTAQDRSRVRLGGVRDPLGGPRNPPLGWSEGVGNRFLRGHAVGCLPCTKIHRFSIDFWLISRPKTSPKSDRKARPQEVCFQTIVVPCFWISCSVFHAVGHGCGRLQGKSDMPKICIFPRENTHF